MQVSLHPPDRMIHFDIVYLLDINLVTQSELDKCTL